VVKEAPLSDKLINKYIYGYLPEGVLEKLQELNPVMASGWRATQNHRFMTDTGNIHLDRQITSTTTIMALSADAADFDENFHKVHTKRIPVRETLELKAPKVPPSLPLFPNIDEDRSA
jgi:hypothetical protein